jgi:hypothetical protein
MLFMETLICLQPLEKRITLALGCELVWDAMMEEPI